MKKDNYIDKIVAYKKKEVERLINETKIKPQHPLNKILNQNYPSCTRFSSSLRKSKLAVIGEVKRESPTAGKIGQIEDSAELALKYCKGGVSAISVLTDSKSFGGTLSDLSMVTQVVSVEYPNVATLRKDFIIHPLQLAEAVYIGADAILLIASAIRNDLKFLMHEAKRLGLEVLVEVHDIEDLELALEVEASIIGINHRNLATFEINFTVSETLKPLIPSHIITVAESGIHQPSKAKHMRELGFDAVLVGEALVRSKNPITLIKQMKGESSES